MSVKCRLCAKEQTNEAIEYVKGEVRRVQPEEHKYWVGNDKSIVLP